MTNIGDLMFGVPASENRVLAEDVQIVREFADYSLSVCVPKASVLEVLETFIHAQKGTRWALATGESDFINPCSDSENRQHVLFLAADEPQS